MAGDWIKVEKSTPRKPEVLEISEMLGIHADHAFGLCVRFWCWCDDQMVDGRTKRISESTLDAVFGRESFAHALIQVGWLQVRNGSLEVPNFDRHMSHTAKVRVDAAERKRKSRHKNVTKKRDSRHRHVTGCHIPRALRRAIYERDNHTCVYCGWDSSRRDPTGEWMGARLSVDHVLPVTQGGQTTSANLVTCCSVCNGRKNNRTPAEAGMEMRFGPGSGSISGHKNVTKKRDASSLLFSSLSSCVLDSGGIKVPERLCIQEFSLWWNKWVSHRIEIKKPLKPTQAESQLAQFAEWGPERAIAAIKHTITKGWQGIREPDGDGRKRYPTEEEIGF